MNLPVNMLHTYMCMNHIQIHTSLQRNWLAACMSQGPCATEHASMDAHDTDRQFHCAQVEAAYVPTIQKRICASSFQRIVYMSKRANMNSEAPQTFPCNESLGRMSKERKSRVPWALLFFFRARRYTWLCVLNITRLRDSEQVGDCWHEWWILHVSGSSVIMCTWCSFLCPIFIILFQSWACQILLRIMGNMGVANALDNYVAKECHQDSFPTAFSVRFFRIWSALTCQCSCRIQIRVVKPLATREHSASLGGVQSVACCVACDVQHHEFTLGLLFPVTP